MNQSQEKTGLFQKLKNLIVPDRNLGEVDLTLEIHLQGHEIRVLNKGTPLQVLLGQTGQRLQLHPNPSIRTPIGEHPRCLLIIDPDRYFNEISGFIRLEHGKTLLLGNSDEEQKTIFNYPNGVAQRHLTITHDGDAIVFKDLNTDAGTYISTLGESPEVNLITENRQNGLSQIERIFGGPIQALSYRKALQAIRSVNTILEDAPCRPKDSRGLPGGTVQIPEALTPIIVGDLHGQVDNLLKILTENNFLPSLERKEACLIILGDAVHSERDGQMEEMHPSMLMMDLIFRLMIHFPEQIFYIRGNHDSFSADVRKASVPQGLLWEKYLRATRGEQYQSEMQRFYEQIPVIALSKEFIACHAAPPKAKVNLELLINTHQYPGLVKELIWNRLQRPNYPAGYTKGDVKRFRKALDLDSEIPFIVAHNPLNQDDSIWLHAGEINNHHIVFSGRPHCIAVFTRIGGQMVPLLFPTEPILERAQA
ncbi:MAG: metallophosphoesterase [Magnetococcales bacterium]|nr:metallophosphoesterase [Magnetococcales bacterium]